MARKGRHQGGTSADETCVALDVASPLPTSVSVTAEAVSGRAGETVGVVVGDDGRFVLSADLGAAAASVNPRHPAVRAVSLLLRWSVQWGPGLLGLGLLALATTTEGPDRKATSQRER